VRAKKEDELIPLFLSLNIIKCIFKAMADPKNILSYTTLS